MIAEFSTGIVLFIIIVAFLCEYIDSTLGMGYGTTLSPLLLLAGFEPLQIVPAILLSELISGILAALFHHSVGNVTLKPKTLDVPLVVKRLKELGYIESFKKGFPIHLRIALLLATCSIVGTIVAVFMAVSISIFWLKLYIGLLVLSMGMTIIICYNKKFRFSWRKIIALGLVASFNKGMSGGGYGPVVTSGQILSGVESKSAIGITSLAEGLTCLVGVITYLLLSHKTIDWRFAPYIVIGAVFSVPLAALSVKRIGTQKLKVAVAIFTIVLGLFTILKTFKII